MRSRFGSIAKYGKDRYQAQWRENGARRSKRCTSYQEACITLAQAQLRCNKPDQNITYDKYYKGVVIPSYKHLSKRTRAEHEHAWADLAPYIKNFKVKDSNWRLVQQTIDNFSAYSRQRRNLAFWKRMLNFAIKDELLLVNPCMGIKLKPHVRKQKELYTRDELIAVLNAINGTEFAIPVLLECCCGLRHEEMCALNYRDFEFKDNGWCYITVNHALTSVYGKKVLKECKNDHSNRVVVLHGSFVQYLLDNKSFMTNKRTLKEYTASIVISRRWLNYCKKNNIKHVTFGNMRSVYATLTAEAGCLDSLVSKSMGHSGSTIREKNYQTVTMQALKLNASVFSEYIAFKYEKNDSTLAKNSSKKSARIARISTKSEKMTPDDSKIAI